MKRSEFIFVITVVSGTLALTAIGWAALWIVLSPPAISPEHREVIKKLENREFASLEEIEPKPDHIQASGHIQTWVENSRWFIRYVLKGGGSLDILLDEHLRLISWQVARD